jgi:hypothetical protein
MSMGAYDEAEHERRELKSGTIDADFSEARHEFRGTVTFEDGGTPEELMAVFEQIKKG